MKLETIKAQAGDFGIVKIFPLPKRWQMDEAIVIVDREKAAPYLVERLDIPKAYRWIVAHVPTLRACGEMSKAKAIQQAKDIMARKAGARLHILPGASATDNEPVPVTMTYEEAEMIACLLRSTLEAGRPFPIGSRVIASMAMDKLESVTGRSRAMGRRVEALPDHSYDFYPDGGDLSISVRVRDGGLYLSGTRTLVIEPHCSNAITVSHEKE